MVDDLNNGSESSRVWSGAEESDTANLHVPPLTCCHVCVAHVVEYADKADIWISNCIFTVFGVFGVPRTGRVR